MLRKPPGRLTADYSPSGQVAQCAQKTRNGPRTLFSRQNVLYFCWLQGDVTSFAEKYNAILRRYWQKTNYSTSLSLLMPPYYCVRRSLRSNNDEKSLSDGTFFKEVGLRKLRLNSRRKALDGHCVCYRIVMLTSGNSDLHTRLKPINSAWILVIERRPHACLKS